MNILAKGIDVSYWQKEINWEKVKNDGVDFAILRCGYGGDDEKQDDKFFARNLCECERLNIPYGVYLYSYADSVEKAKSEAKHVLRLLGNKKPLYPVYYDLEDEKTVGKCGKTLILQMAKTFCSEIEEKGFVAGIYANKHWNTTFLTDSWYDTKPRWVAQYAKKCSFGGDYGIWQYSSKGSVEGIDGNVDMNYAYVDYPAIIAAHYSADSVPEKSDEEVAEEVIKGIWGNGEERKEKLTAAGYDYQNIQKAVNSILKSQTKKSNEELAQEVFDGKWGNGEDRKKRLTAAGYNYEAVQNIVNQKAAKTSLKTLDEIAKQVIRGDWGNGKERTNKLTALGYDAKAVQKRVNEILG